MVSNKKLIWFALICMVPTVAGGLLFYTAWNLMEEDYRKIGLPNESRLHQANGKYYAVPRGMGRDDDPKNEISPEKAEQFREMRKDYDRHNGYLFLGWLIAACGFVPLVLVIIKELDLPNPFKE